jgi:hypothetical protein
MNMDSSEGIRGKRAAHVLELLVERFHETFRVLARV